MKIITILLFGLVLLMAVSVIAADKVDKNLTKDNIQTTTIDSVNVQKSEQFVIYYLHMNRRCMTCEKLEAYSEKAIMNGFAKELKDSSLVWKSINFEEKGNEHFAKTYKLYSQSLVISKHNDGKETTWKNLDKIWTLVNNKDEYTTYVQNSVKEFMKPTKKE